MCPGFGCGYPVCGYPGYGSTFGGGGWIIAILIVIFVLFLDAVLGIKLFVSNENHLSGDFCL